MDEEDSDFKDTRNRAEKIGERQVRVGKPRANFLTIEKTSLNTAQRATRQRARNLALDYAEEMVLEAVRLAKEAQSESVRLEAVKFLISHSLGKPATVNFDGQAVSTVPNLTIVIGDQPVSFETFQTLDAEIIDGED